MAKKNYDAIPWHSQKVLYSPYFMDKKIPTALKIQCTCGLLLENLNQCKPTP